MRRTLAILVLAAALATSTSAAPARENPFVLARNAPSDYQVWQQWEIHVEHK